MDNHQSSQTASPVFRVGRETRATYIATVFRGAQSVDSTCSAGRVAQWIRHRPTEPGIVGSSPTGVTVGSCNIVDSSQLAAPSFTHIEAPSSTAKG